jgi:hypothetical protein
MFKRATRTKLHRFLHNKAGISDVISATMLAGTVITLSLIIFAWSGKFSSDYGNQASGTTASEIDRLKEKLVVEYIHYNTSLRSVTVYLLNCGTIDNVALQSVYASNSSWYQVFSAPSMRFLNATVVTSLNRGEEGYVILQLSGNNNLKKNAYYSIRIATVRGSTFDSSFVS